MQVSILAFAKARKSFGGGGEPVKQNVCTKRSTIVVAKGYALDDM